MEVNSKSKTTSEINRYLVFNLGNENYAVDLLKVKEVITPPDLTPIPKAPSYVCGLMNLRGLVLTVVDLRKKLGIAPKEGIRGVGLKKLARKAPRKMPGQDLIPLKRRKTTAIPEGNHTGETLLIVASSRHAFATIK